MERKHGPRARDADRNEVIETLQSAYVEGQLDSDERERRTERALAATHLSELSDLVSDLQSVPARATPVASPPRRAKAGLVLVGLAAAGILVATLLLVIPDEESPAAPAPQGQADAVEDPDEDKDSDQPFVLWSKVKHTLPRAMDPERPPTIKDLDRWSPTQENVEAVLARYRGPNGTTYFDGLSIYPQYLNINRPVTGARPTMQRWSLYTDHGLTVGSAESLGVREKKLMDLNDVDIPKLFDNIDYAIKHLDAPEAEFLHASIDFFADKPQVSIYVQDPYDTTAVGYLNTTLAGTIYQEHGLK